jgi:hypothetical protein
MCSRFFAVLPSGTVMNSQPVDPVFPLGISATFSLCESNGRCSAAEKKWATAATSEQSTVMWMG